MQPTPGGEQPPVTETSVVTALATARTAIDALHDELRADPATEQVGRVASEGARCRSLAGELAATGMPTRMGRVAQCDTLAAEWAGVAPKVTADARQIDERFRVDLESLDRAFSDAALVVAAQQPADDLLAGLVTRSTTMKDDLQRARADALRPGSAIEERYLAANAAMAADVELIQGFARASFKLEADEQPVRFVRAKTVTEGWNAQQEGVLYASDRRLVLDAGVDDGPHAVAFEARFADLAEVRPAKEGFLGHEDHIYVRPAAPGATETHFHLYGQDAETWRYPAAPH